MKSSVYNLFFRGLTIFLKFVLSVIVIKAINIEEYGTFGLFQSTVIIMTFVVGLDFYAYGSREILSKGTEYFDFYFKNQLFFYLITYLLFVPFSYLLVVWGIIDLKYTYLFILILLSVHLSL